MNDIRMPDVRICRMGQYAALMVNGAMVELQDFSVVQTMNGENKVTVTFAVPNDTTELTLGAVREEQPNPQKKSRIMDMIQKWNKRFI